MSADGYLGLRQCFTGLDALVPRVTELDVTITSTGPEPRTTVTAATNFPRFRDDSAFGTHGTNGCRRGCWCVNVGIGQNVKIKTRKTVTLLGLQEDTSTWR